MGALTGNLYGAQVDSRPGTPPSLTRDVTVPPLVGLGVHAPVLKAHGKVSEGTSLDTDFEVDESPFTIEFGELTLDTGRVLSLENLDQLVKEGATPLSTYALVQSVKVNFVTILLHSHLLVSLL